MPQEWAWTQYRLGLAIATLGNRESDPTHLQDAIDALHAALQVQTREHMPVAWARTQNRLGFALWTLGKRESDPTHLRDAIDALRAALQVQTREHMPAAWARTQSDLGLALRVLGLQTNDVTLVETALECHIDAWGCVEEDVPYYASLFVRRFEADFKTLKEVAPPRYTAALTRYRDVLERMGLSLYTQN